MEFLSNEQENTLHKIIDYCVSNGKWEINCSRDNMSRTIIESLIIDGYVENFVKPNNYGLYVLLPTQKGKDYFMRKEEVQRQSKAIKKKFRNAKIADWIKYGITTLIAVGALIVSIISICQR